MEQYFTKALRLYEEQEFSTKIFADQEYVEIVGNTDLHDKMKKIIFETWAFYRP